MDKSCDCSSFLPSPSKDIGSVYIPNPVGQRFSKLDFNATLLCFFHGDGDCDTRSGDDNVDDDVDAMISMVRTINPFMVVIVVIVHSL